MTEVIPWRDTSAHVSAQNSGKSSEQTRIEENPGARKLTVPIIPFSKVDELEAGMRRGEKITSGATFHPCAGLMPPAFSCG